MDKRSLSERDICTKYITPALERVGWDIHTEIREEFPLTKGRIIIRGKLHTRAQNKRADYVLFYKPGIPIAIIEAKDNTHSLGAGMQQALSYAEMLDVPFVFSANGDVADQIKMIEKAKKLLGLCDDLELKLDLIRDKQGEVLWSVMRTVV